ncbi:MAG TPA: hypothetical protein VKR58_03400, partial [Aquella sp.]|nr:hypothetical protein [Aquella sp.]
MTSRTVFIFICIFSNLVGSKAQKPKIGYADCENWPTLGQISLLSNDGNYLLYSTHRGHLNLTTLVAKAIKGNWQKDVEFVNPYSAWISPDSKTAVFITDSDSLGFLTLGSNKIRFIPNVKSFKTIQNGNANIVAYIIQNRQRELVVEDLKSGNKNSFFNVADYFLSDDGSILLINKEIISSNTTYNYLQWIDTKNNRCDSIWRGTKLTNITFDNINKQLAFIGETNLSGNLQIWYYAYGRTSAVSVVSDSLLAADFDVKISSVYGFKRDGSSLFINVCRNLADSKKMTSINVFSYLDHNFHFFNSGMTGKEGCKEQLSVINLTTKKFSILVMDDETLIPQENGLYTGDNILVLKRQGDESEWNWNNNSKASIKIVSTIDGKQIPILKEEVIKYPYIVFSPDQKYVVFFDPKTQNYFSYSIQTHLILNISEKIDTKWTEMNFGELTEQRYSPIGIGGWLKNSEGVLIYDRHDIWLVFLNNEKLPVNVTNGYGNINKLEFRLAIKDSAISIRKDTGLILSSFDFNTKNAGFYRTNLSNINNPIKLSMGPFIYQDIYHGADNFGFSILKAGGCKAFV